MRRAAKVDENQAEIVSALRARGYGVLSLAALGNGAPDLLVCSPSVRYAMWLLEVKDGNKPPSRRKLTPDQEKFHEWWPGEIHVVKSVDEALAAVGAAGEW